MSKDVKPRKTYFLLFTFRMVNVFIFFFFFWLVFSFLLHIRSGREAFRHLDVSAISSFSCVYYKNLRFNPLSFHSRFYSTSLNLADLKKKTRRKQRIPNESKGKEEIRQEDAQQKKAHFGQRYCDVLANFFSPLLL